jgi:hypothetical protein
MHRTTFSAVNPARQIAPMLTVVSSAGFRLVASILQEYYSSVRTIVTNIFIEFQR